MKAHFARIALFSATTLLPTILADRQLTVINNCDTTLWPAFFSAVNPPNAPTGWEAPPGDERSITLPTGWIGRVWARTECTDFSIEAPPLQCSSGGCNGGLECKNSGVPPVSLAEFTIDAGDLDWYDVSLVDGFNVPMSIDNTGDDACFKPDCFADINANCPAELQVKSPLTGQVVGCKHDCLVSPNPANSASCCSGEFSTPDKCPPSGVPHYDTFKGACPNAYAYAYDESSKTALWTCPSAQQVDYTVTFCPGA